MRNLGNIHAIYNKVLFLKSCSRNLVQQTRRLPELQQARHAKNSYRAQLNQPSSPNTTKMRILSLLLPVLSLLSSTVRSDDVGPETPPNTHSVTLHKWSLSATSPIPLGTVRYNPQTETGDYEVTKVGDVVGDDEVVRVGVWDGKDGWFGCVTAGVSWPLWFGR